MPSLSLGVDPDKQKPLPGYIEHVVVLMMENRSFDHMLGYLDHPDPRFEGLKKSSYAPGYAPLPTTDNARYAISPGPDHSFEGVMHQLLGTRDIPPGASRYQVNNRGFAASYELIQEPQHRDKGYGDKVMRCFNPALLPVLSTLALEYAVCDHWFCSAPMGTFPNRDFLHAGTAFGRADNGLTPRRQDLTIFRRLDVERQRNWRLYHGDASQLWLYPQLFIGRRNKSCSHDVLIDDIGNDNLPTYAFVEPDYGLIGDGESQHPNFSDGLGDFVRGEALIARIYNAFIEERQRSDSKKVFDRSLFIITYDEHGGFYDHVPPPSAISPDTLVYDPNRHRFRYNLLGPRVPTVIISPWIERNTLDDTVFDHTSIYQTVRKSFCVNASPAGDRDGTAHTVAHLMNRSTPRSPHAEDALDSVVPVYPLSQDQAEALQAVWSAPPDETDELSGDDGLLDDLRRISRPF